MTILAVRSRAVRAARVRFTDHQAGAALTAAVATTVTSTVQGLHVGAAALTATATTTADGTFPIEQGAAAMTTAATFTATPTALPGTAWTGTDAWVGADAWPGAA